MALALVADNNRSIPASLKTKPAGACHLSAGHQMS
jgi:hypothetical protein